MNELPQIGKSRDGVYPRCVWCRGENYAPAVLAYSAGEIPCAAASSCGQFLPNDYISHQAEVVVADLAEPTSFIGRPWSATPTTTGHHAGAAASTATTSASPPKARGKVMTMYEPCSREHRGPEGPNEDIGMCECGRMTWELRPEGQTYGKHLADCSLPPRHQSYCKPGGEGHPEAPVIRGYWPGG